ncbi:MAG: HAD-IA family hydrolase [Gemmatimonadetes bacterium]|nr:HAD-IA family hydrolase [Gemmatimonadota bacterium]NNM04457.1 HAD-IA family hydrolase [Gemmatimonadota bacterium]
MKAILFDAGNTLVFIDSSVVLPILEEHGAHVEEARFREAEFSARRKLTRRVEEGAWGTENHIWKEYFANLFRFAGVPEESVDAVGERIREVHEERHLWSYMDPATPGALDRLDEAGYRMAIISNADGRVERLIEDAGIRDRFEFVMDSELEGVEKPDPEIFLRACRRMGLKPGESLYVGDLYGVDVVGARNAGLEAVLLDPLGRLDYPVDRIRDVSALPAYMEQLSHRP